jgi:hypothetical protein
VKTSLSRVAFAFILLCMTGSGVAIAQDCRPIVLNMAKVGAESVKLFDLDGKAQGHLAKAALPVSLPATDCGDPSYVMIEWRGASYLLRKNDLTMPPIDTGCICPSLSPARRPILGTPGIETLRHCPVKQCPKP